MLKYIVYRRKNCGRAVELGQLRQNLYYRISSVIIRIPPLRERIVDINLLVCSFIDKYNKILNTQINSIDSKLIEACMSYECYGNIRELEHMIESAMNISHNFLKNLYLDLVPVLQPLGSYQFIVVFCIINLKI